MTIPKIKAKSTQNLIKLLTANKKLFMNINLSEIKSMTPQEIWCLKEEVNRVANLIKQAKEENAEKR